MNEKIDRHGFICRASLAIASLGVAPAITACAASSRTRAGVDPRLERPPPLPATAVREFVVAAHADLERTRELLEVNPSLLNATWDWGAGDFETALGGASHMGRRDIVELLLANGARIDLFCAAMLNMLPVVRAVLERHPDALHWPGPHGISLMQHAEAADATRVRAFLSSLPG